jgi:hypothetical protein
MGSGTTGIACLNLNRKFIGIESDLKYFQAAKERIEKRYSEGIPRAGFRQEGFQTKGLIGTDDELQMRCGDKS